MKRARTCEVAAHVRTLPYAAEYTATHDELRKAFALTVMEREIERIVRAEVALASGEIQS
jgi:hypothetical protein